VDIRGITHLKEVIDSLARIRSVIKVERVREHLKKDAGREASA